MIEVLCGKKEEEASSLVHLVAERENREWAWHIFLAFALAELKEWPFKFDGIPACELAKAIIHPHGEVEGVPDLKLVPKEGKAFYVEVKSPGVGGTETQVHRYRPCVLLADFANKRFKHQITWTSVFKALSGKRTKVCLLLKEALKKEVETVNFKDTYVRDVYPPNHPTGDITSRLLLENQIYTAKSDKRATQVPPRYFAPWWTNGGSRGPGFDIVFPVLKAFWTTSYLDALSKTQGAGGEQQQIWTDGIQSAEAFWQENPEHLLFLLGKPAQIRPTGGGRSVKTAILPGASGNVSSGTRVSLVKILRHGRPE